MYNNICSTYKVYNIYAKKRKTFGYDPTAI